MCDFNQFNQIHKFYKELDETMMMLGNAIERADLCVGVKLNIITEHLANHLAIRETLDKLRDAEKFKTQMDAQKN